MIILMTAYSTTQTTIEAMKFGAFDYIMKPFDLKRILTLTESAIAASKDLDKAGREEAAPSVSKEDIDGGIIGSSSAMQEGFKMIGQVAASDVTVMITGESGTGKELRRLFSKIAFAHRSPTSRSTVRQYLRTSLRVSSSVTRKAPSRARPISALVSLSFVMVAPSFLMRSATWP